MTQGELRLWAELKLFKRNYGLHVRKQVPIGPYIADFAIHSKRIIIEVDGEHHYSANGIKRDKIRDAWFAEQGYKVLHINTGELSETFDACLNSILYEAGVMS